MLLKSSALLAVAAIGLASQAASAATLIGTSVNGSLMFGVSLNYFDPANGFVPASGYLNSSPGTNVVTVAEPAVEFGYQNSANRDVANFTSSQLVISDQTFSGTNGVAGTFTFTDSGFAGLAAVLAANTFTVTPTAAITGTTLTVNIPAFTVPATNYEQLLVINLVAVPEPTSIALLGLGGFGLLRRRNRN